jgi:hypothetical protein
MKKVSHLLTSYLLQAFYGVLSLLLSNFFVHSLFIIASQLGRTPNPHQCRLDHCGTNQFLALFGYRAVIDSITEIFAQCQYRHPLATIPTHVHCEHSVWIITNQQTSILIDDHIIIEPPEFRDI